MFPRWVTFFSARTNYSPSLSVSLVLKIDLHAINSTHNPRHKKQRSSGATEATGLLLSSLNTLAGPAATAAQIYY